MTHWWTPFEAVKAIEAVKAMRQTERKVLRLLYAWVCYLLEWWYKMEWYQVAGSIHIMWVNIWDCTFRCICYEAVKANEAVKAMRPWRLLRPLRLPRWMAVKPMRPPTLMQRWYKWNKIQHPLISATASATPGEPAMTSWGATHLPLDTPVGHQMTSLWLHL